MTLGRSNDSRAKKGEWKQTFPKTRGCRSVWSTTSAVVALQQPCSRNMKKRFLCQSCLHRVAPRPKNGLEGKNYMTSGFSKSTRTPTVLQRIPLAIADTNYQVFKRLFLRISPLVLSRHRVACASLSAVSVLFLFYLLKHQVVNLTGCFAF